MLVFIELLIQISGRLERKAKTIFNLENKLFFGLNFEHRE